ncbi:MAG: antirestriction protein ArdA [Oscillospiraceae bacterium]
MTLPATFYKLEDALEKARIPDDIIYSSDILTCELEYLPRFIDIDANLHELNHLAHRLSALNEWELDCFEGMVMMDAIQTEYAPIPVERLINMTRSMEHCQIAYEAHDDASLGKFYVDNGFVPDSESLPENAFDCLDYGKIGKEMREGEGGVFTPHGYVAQNGEIAKTYQSGDAIPAENPDYMILLQVRKESANDPQLDNHMVALLPLPADDAAVFQVLESVGAKALQECTLRIDDCIAPGLMELFPGELAGCDGDITVLDALTDQLYKFKHEGRLTTYKAMLEAAPKSISLEDAIDLADHTEEFTLMQGTSSPADYARKELEKHGLPLIDDLLSRAHLAHYGTKLMEQGGAINTDYGVLLPLNGQTLEQCFGRSDIQMDMS